MMTWLEEQLARKRAYGFTLRCARDTLLSFIRRPQMSPDKRGEFALSFLSTYGVKPNRPPAAIEGGGRAPRFPAGILSGDEIRRSALGIVQPERASLTQINTSSRPSK